MEAHRPPAKRVIRNALRPRTPGHRSHNMLIDKTKLLSWVAPLVGRGVFRQSINPFEFDSAKAEMISQIDGFRVIIAGVLSLGEVVR